MVAGRRPPDYVECFNLPPRHQTSGKSPPRYSRRLGGIVSAAKAGRIRNLEWGRHMRAKRGGRAMAEEHLEMFRAMAPRAWRRSVEVRQLRKRREAYEREWMSATTSPLPD